MGKAIQITCVVLFFLMLCAPAAQEYGKIVSFEELQENRVRKTRPKGWSGLFADGATFTREYEEYFNDTFGFRDLLIKIKHQIDFSLLRHSDRAVIGRDGWIFYKDVVHNQQEWTETHARPKLDWIMARLEAMQRDLKARGMTLIILPLPMQDTVYAEMLPANAPRRPHPSVFTLYRQRLRQHPDIVVVDGTPILFQLKRKFYTYHKTDFHWTDPAAAHVAKLLVEKIGELERTGTSWDQPLRLVKTRESKGGIAMDVGLLWPPETEWLSMDYAAVRHLPGQQTTDPEDWTFQPTEPDQAPLPPVLVFGDSFADGMIRAGLMAYFKRFQKIYNLNFTTGYAKIPPDTRYVVFEHLETALLNLSMEGYWPPALLAAPEAPAQPDFQAPVTQVAAVVAPASPTPDQPAALAAPAEAPAAPADKASLGKIWIDPHPVPICKATGMGNARVFWSTRVPVHIRVGKADGSVMGTAATDGFADTGHWVSKGETFVLQPIESTSPADTIARAVVTDTVDGPCP